MSLTPISQKAHDIAHATFRCAAIMSNLTLKKELENSAVEFLSLLSALNNSQPNFNSPVDKLERLISLAESIGELSTVNAMVLRRELVNLQTAIETSLANQTANHLAPEAKEAIDISSMFAESSLPDSMPEGSKPVDQLNASLPVYESISSRQEKILRFIREIPFCRLRNILEMMPDVSERTIRNDIQALIEQDLVKRVGGGGPNSYFESMELALPARQSVQAK